MSTPFLLPPKMDGKRLDQALAALLPHLSLRGCRRYIEAGNVLINGKHRKAAHRLRQGDELLLMETNSHPSLQPAETIDPPRFLSLQNDYCFLYKPGGLHATALAGGNTPNLCDHLPALLQSHSIPDKVQLLGRLDFETSGIICAALSDRAFKDFREAELAGLCEKRYLALLTGCLQEAVTVRRGLDTANRRKSHLLDNTCDATRWTTFLPLLYLEENNISLVGCLIKRGARHQIRAHAAAIGYPLRHDALYGNADAQPEMAKQHTFFLHHGAMCLPGASCMIMPPWPLPDPAAALAQKYLETSHH